ncbi:hypothetical protein [Amycolatopsis sp. CA-230715]|uniref:hypothetical protein n=1 Tax=Amycolatopsis sp. CA-230715 TaxID=2745196 RepID=UPI001C02F866|nr:hypothetical protein [Amycolatopsis sp. CA-230715]QWF77805.1 hypothetical protein HUW46_01198 [Amycolatopsis sp. CA-230715]
MSEPRSEQTSDEPADDLLEASRRHVKEAKDVAESQEWRLGAEQPAIAEDAPGTEGAS